jgi:hydroxymethylglutaryl-CoA lyase
MTESIQIVDVTPRDGLQNESVLLDTEAKVELIERLIEAGLRRIEVTAFVSPKAVPAMADAEEVLARLPRRDDVRYSALVVNERGVERAVQTEVHELNAVVVCSDTLGQRNQRMTTAEALAAWSGIARLTRDADRTPTVTLAAAFGCPFEGEISEDRVVETAIRAAEAGPAEISLADTIGVGAPGQTERLVARVRETLDPRIALRVHLHNTRNTGMANAFAAYQGGVRVFDATLGGIGGCPFAPNATGNIPTEDLAYLFERSGIHTGLDLKTLTRHVPWVAEQIDREPPGLLTRAGIFPPDAAQTDEEEAR